MDATTLEAAFRRGFAVYGAGGSVDDLAAFLAPGALVVADGHTQVLDREQYRDTVAFETGLAESCVLRTYDERFDVEGETGIVSAAYTLRSKPRDSGFRLRHGYLTVICHYDGATRAWQAVGVTFDPVAGHIDRASPG
jgi:hypothetical protein